MDRPTIVFLDDAQFELDNFARNIAPAGAWADFVYDTTYDGAQDRLAGQPVHLFVLDLYGTDPALGPPRIPAPEELAPRAAAIPGLTEVYSGLDQGDPGAVNEYLRRLFGVVHGWREIFAAACDAVGQNRNYGLENLRRAERDHPFAAKVAYTRKALFPDAVACFSAGFDGLFNKPAGRDDAEVAANSAARAPELLAAWVRLVRRRLGRGCRDWADDLEARGEDGAGAALLRALARELAVPGSPTRLAEAQKRWPDRALIRLLSGRPPDRWGC